MRKNKGQSGGTSTKPSTNDKQQDTKAQLDNGAALGVDSSASATANAGAGAAPTGHANPNVPSNAKRDSTGSRNEFLSPMHSFQGLFFQTGDMEVMVGGTHEFRVHQELLSAHSSFFSDQLRASTDSSGLVVAPRSEDIPIVVLRDITAEAFADVLRLIYPSPTSVKQPKLELPQLERLLQTSFALGMHGIVDFAMDMLSNSTGCSPVRAYQYARDFSIPHWQLKVVQELVYRTRPLSNEEAHDLGALVTAQIARLRELFRARIFARFEPVIQNEFGEVQSYSHRGGPDPEVIEKLRLASTGGGLNLGKCQQAILEALKLVFGIEGTRNQLAQYVIRSEVSVVRNFEEWLRLGGIGGGPALCRGCLESVERVATVYCRTEEMNARIEQELGVEK